MMSSSPVARALAATTLALIAVAAAGCGTKSTPSGGSTVTVTAPPGGSASNSASTPAAPTSSAPPAAPAACSTSGLKVRVNGGGAAAGTAYYFLDFTNVSGVTCTLTGYPGVSLVSAGNNSGSQIGSDAKRNSVYPVATITLPPGAIAHSLFGVGHAANYSTCTVVNANWLKVFPPNQYGAVYIKFSTQTCSETSIPIMHVSPVKLGAS